MFDWEISFAPHILAGGRECYRQGAVMRFVRKENTIEAVVEDIDCYKVKISLLGDQPSRVSCSCMSGRRGAWCKHSAALLYRAEEEEKKPLDSVLDDDAEGASDEAGLPLKALIKNADRELLEMLLTELSSRDEANENRIRAVLAGKRQAVDIRHLKKEAEIIFSDHFGAGYFTDRDHCDDLCSELIGFLKRSTGSLIRNGLLMEAFDISVFVYVKFGNTYIDDDRQIDKMSDVCYKIWQKIVSACSDHQRKQIRSWFEKYSCDGTVIDYMEVNLKEFLDYELATRQELLGKIRELDAVIEESGSSIQCRSIFSIHYGRDFEAIQMRVILMQKLGISLEEIHAYMTEHMNFHSVRSYFTKKARQEGNTEEELRLLKESRKLDEGHYGYLRQTMERLIDIYHSLGDTEKEKEERKEALMMLQDSAVEELRACRSLCGREEWEKIREDIIRSRQEDEKKAEFLAEEKMLEELCQLIWRQKNRIRYLDKYGLLLADLYPEQILDQYEAHVDDLMERPHTREWQDEVLQYLRKMLQYRGGKEAIERVRQKWIHA